MNERMIKAYFNQGAQYYSASQETFQVISLMHPRHAANAAAKLLRDAAIWSEDAGMVEAGGRGKCAEFPALWVTSTPLYRALTTRAGF